jgi:hypothetical protein
MGPIMKRFPIGWMAAWALGLSLAGCSSLQDPAKLQWVESEQPDYGNPNQWLSLPSRQDASDAIPKRLPERFADLSKDSLEVDVFFVHPTMYFRGHHWNAQLDNGPVNRATERSPMRLQASAFNIGGRLYAPRYRQAHIGVFTWQDTTSWKALELAYEDVRRAFIHYLENWNEGRGIILAGHSQGSWHLRWLLQEFFDGSALQNQLVVAYGPGFDWYKTDFQQLSFCENPEETGCVCSWMSYGAGYFPPWLDASETAPMCTHPVTWRLEGGNAISDHQGVVLSQMRYAFPASIDARIDRGILQINQPQVPFGKALQRDNWHIGDINLFWMNIRKNARLRAKNFDEHLNLND